MIYTLLLKDDVIPLIWEMYHEYVKNSNPILFREKGAFRDDSSSS
jgi:hypothetical protein